ncbi:MAG: DUF1799 domain-containing protein [Gammaproteobacteria bacterium]|nr:DUF1799 domain-containing protein [Gammaproteobacteria bacterium]
MIIRRWIEQHSFIVFHANWRARCLFLGCVTQWRRETVFASHMKKPVAITHGLDYPAVESVPRASGVKPGRWGRLFRKIQLIEVGALEGFAARMT